MATWKANRMGFVGNRLIQAGDVFEHEDGFDISWADPVDGARPVEAPKPAAPAGDTFAGIQAGPKVQELSAKLADAEARAADLEAKLNEATARVNALEAAPAPEAPDESEQLKALKTDLKAAQKQIKNLEAANASLTDENQALEKNRDDWKVAYDDLKDKYEPDETDHPDEPG